MALDPLVTFINTNGAPFPATEAVNATSPTATDGTEFVKNMIDNYMFGPQQALLEYAGLTPDGIVESASASQELESMKRSFGAPGEVVDWMGQQDPASLGLKLLLLNGQGVLVADYQELTDAVYVGDPNNATAEAFFRADDALGAVRNTAGAYIILPDARGKFKRSLDSSGTIDPDGASRLVGDSQDDAFQGHYHEVRSESGDLPVTYPNGGVIGGQTATPAAAPDAGPTAYQVAKTPIDDGSNGTPRIASETRAKNIAVQTAIRY